MPPLTVSAHAAIGTDFPAAVTQMPPPKKYSSFLPPPQSTTNDTPVHVCGIMYVDYDLSLPTTDCEA